MKNGGDNHEEENEDCFEDEKRRQVAFHSSLDERLMELVAAGRRSDNRCELRELDEPEHRACAEDERQRKVLDHLRMDPRVQQGADLLETSLEGLRTVYQERLQRGREPAKTANVSLGTKQSVSRLYLMYDKRDTDAVEPYADYLFEQKLEVMHPVFEGDEADIREDHEENLRFCDGAVIFYGSTNECWVRRKLREVQKSAGFGRTKPPAVVSILLVPTPAASEDEAWCGPVKQKYRTHEAMVISQLGGFSPDQLRPFLSRLTGWEAGRQPHA